MTEMEHHNNQGQASHLVAEALQEPLLARQLDILGLTDPQAGSLLDPGSFASQVFAEVLRPFNASKADYRREDIGWHADDSTLDAHFEGVLIGGLSPYEVLDRRIGHDGNGVGLDIAGGSNGIALRDLIRKTYVARGLYTHFFDNRDPQTPNPHADLVTGDLTTLPPWQKMGDWQRQNAPEGFSVALHVPRLALQGWPGVAYYISTSAQVDMMKPGGVIFTQIPSSLYMSPPQEDALEAMYNAIGQLPSVEGIEPASTNTYGAEGYNFCTIYTAS